MTQHAEVSGRELELLRYKCNVLKDAVSQASQATAASFMTLIVLLCVFALVTYSNFVSEEVSVPFLTLTLNRWHAAALGPPLVSFAALNFASTRALLQMRIKLLIPHLKALLEDVPDSHNPQQITSEEFVGAVLHPSVHVVVDYLYVRNWPGFRLVIGILMSIWSLVPVAVVHMTYTVLTKYHWNPILTALYVMTLAVGLYSFIHLLKAQQADVYFDFND